MPKYILAIDPGNVVSAFVIMDKETLKPIEKDIIPNAELLEYLKDNHDKGDTELVIEMVASYGMAVGTTIFETVFWIGRFYQASKHYYSRDRLVRMAVKMHICHNSRAKDTNIRQALIDRFGVVGTKKNQGWFYGFKRDIWAAYAVGVTYAEKD